MLAKTFTPTIDVSEYWICEKLDGVRARWNGQDLISRGGHPLKAPQWFTAGFPKQVLDGELWLARGKYQQTVAIVSKHTPHSGWQKIKFMVFDLPNHPGSFNKRVTAMQTLNTRINSHYLDVIKQFQLSSQTELMQYLDNITLQGGEGLMLHHKAALYQQGRSNNLLKLKKFTDTEAVVIGYRAGKGQFTGKMGALQVKTALGKIFYIGTGFSHQQRAHPPAIGSIISFRYQGKTDSGIPRFAVFLRIRNEP
jgi:DNA ligase-1